MITVNRDVAMSLSALGGFTGADRIYMGDFYTGFSQLAVLLMFMYAHLLLEDEALVTFRLVLFSVMVVWWIIDVCVTGYKASSPGNEVIGNIYSKWDTEEPDEHRNSLIVAIMFSVFVTFVPEWSPMQMSMMKAL
jgi:TM2 domain-containing membrane protein YozV